MVSMGFTDDINPSVLAHYWGGNKMNIRQDLETVTKLMKQV